MDDVRTFAGERFTDAQREQIRGKLAHRLVALGYEPEIQAFPEGLNIIGTRPGAEGIDTPPASPTVLVAAHFDTVEGSPGADDNATGLAAALELARIFRTPTHRALRIVFFDQEEADLLGSRRYAAAASRREGVVAVVVFDMLGDRCRTPGCQSYPPKSPVRPSDPDDLGDTGDFLLAVGNMVDPGLLARFRWAGGRGRPEILALPVADRGVSLPDTRRSDHAPFWDADVPAVLLTDTGNLRNPRYHNTSDVPEAVDAEFLAGNVQSIAWALDGLLRQL